MKTLFFLGIMFLTIYTGAQTIVSGKITNEAGNPLADVIISVKGTSFKTFSDENGEYSIKVPKNYNTIVFQKEGFNVNEVVISSDRIDIKMTSALDIFELSLEQLLNIQVYTASRQVEEIEQVPVPITVITEEMIRNSSALNLRDLILQYVPGFTNAQDHNEINFAMRGIYASSQQKVLILLNGHRLNSRAYSMANPDFSISLQKIKQIEVLRGPASSLYGNVALTAVINIITKDGESVNGMEVNALYGNYGQKGTNLLYGRKEGNSDFLFWGNFYRSDGEKIQIDQSQDYSQNPHSGYAIVNGFKERPSFDIGMEYQHSTFRTLFNIRNCKYISPFTDGSVTGEVYNYDLYRSFAGQKPGLGSLSGHLLLEKQFVFNDGFSLNFNLYADFNELLVNLMTVPKDTMFSILEWKEIATGGEISLSKDYSLSSFGKGNLLFGYQFDQFDLFDSYMISGKGGELKNFTDNSQKRILQLGQEMIHSAFIQFKHNYSDFLIFNFGTRFDYKIRHKGDPLYDVSPRLAIVVLPFDFLDLKLSYSQSFVDAPYWYRYNSLPSYLGSENLKPEHLRSVQFTPNLKLFKNKMIIQANLFYNYLYDFIFRDPNATGDMPRYINAGSLDLLGAEFVVMFKQKFFDVNTNATYFYPWKAKNFSFTDNKIWNVPNYFGNLTIDLFPLAFNQKYGRKIALELHIQYISEQLSPIKSTFLNNQPYEDLNYTVKSTLLFNAALVLHNIRNISLKFQSTNIADTRYYQGGSTRFPYPQPGRWYSFSLGYYLK